MQYQFDGSDGAPDIITCGRRTCFDRTAGTLVPSIEVLVRNPVTGVDDVYYRDRVSRIDSIRLVGTSDDETFVIEPSVTKVVSVLGGFGNDTVVGPNAPDGVAADRRRRRHRPTPPSPTSTSRASRASSAAPVPTPSRSTALAPSPVRLTAAAGSTPSTRPPASPA